MSIAVSGDPRIQDFRVTRDELIARLVDGRVIHVPLVWSWRLADASPAERANFRITGGGQFVHWPDIDEDISVEGMLGGSPAPRSGRSRTGRSAGVHASDEVREEGPGYVRKPGKRTSRGTQSGKLGGRATRAKRKTPRN